MIALIAALAVSGQEPIHVPPPSSRFELAAPFPGLRFVRVDREMSRAGVAQQMARRRGLQARILWVDGTANLNAVSSDEKVDTLVRNAVEAGFNTLVFDVKPIVGYTLYPSKLTEKLPAWRGQSLPLDYNPLAAMCRSAKARGITLLVSLNAFSEGHSFAKRDEGKPDSQFGKPGPGYATPELQTWQYDPTPVLAVGRVELPVHPTPNPTRWSEPIAVFTRPQETTAARFISVNPQGVVIAQASQMPDQIATGGAVLAAATTEAGEALGRLGVGARVSLGSKAQFRPIAENQRQIPLMMNPHHSANRTRTLEFLREVLEGYPVDGVLFDDRLRFGGFNADFSERTRSEFEAFVRARLTWPDDVYRATYTHTLAQGIKPGPYFDAWLTFRALAMRNWVAEARALVDEVRPGALFGIYAGSWYGDYAQYGSNYGSPGLEAGFPFLNASYAKTGFAGLLDMLITGCYYRVGTIEEALARAAPVGRTVEAGGIVSNRVARDQTWTYAGIMIADYWDDPRMLESALQAAAATTQGVMVFDHSHRIEQFWPVFRRAFKEPATAPHAQPGLLEAVRAERRRLDMAGAKEPPFPILEGAPGAGF